MKTLYKNAILSLAALMIFCAAGCYQVVHVQDMAGEPVKDARVATKYSKDQGGGSGQWTKTNRWGDAYLPVSMTGDVPAWLQITCDGYMTCEMLYRTGDKITVDLKPIR